MEQQTKKPPAWLLVAGACLLLVGTFFVGVQNTSAQPQQPPEQPIAFFHVVHVGQQGIDCRYCHRTAETADFAGMPDTQVCMSCHRAVIPQYPEIWKIRSYWEMGSAIPWKRVNSLPGHVFFSHKAHTAAAHIGCEKCHGKLETQGSAQQTEPLTMGWCLKCHKQQQASTECIACHR
jgi:hypothetical protein